MMEPVEDGKQENPVCGELYEQPGAWPHGVHTCRLVAGHEGAHSCPACGNWWLNLFSGAEAAR